MHKVCIIILANSLSVKDEFREAVAKIPAEEKQRRDLGALRNFGIRSSDIFPVVYAREEDMDEVKGLYQAREKATREGFYEDITFKVLEVQDAIPVEQWEQSDFENLKKTQLIDLCREREDLFGEISHSTLNKEQLVEAMTAAVTNIEE